MVIPKEVSHTWSPPPPFLFIKKKKKKKKKKIEETKKRMNPILFLPVFKCPDNGRNLNRENCCFKTTGKQSKTTQVS